VAKAGRLVVSSDLDRTMRGRLWLSEPHPQVEKETQMYGTIARLRIQPGRESDVAEHLNQYQASQLPGFVASAFYRADEGGAHWLAVVFDSKESYRANADSPEQGARYSEFRSFLEADPEWHDGEVLLRQTAS
jgi:antibiotic biosynthesis monooxygenase (ABM) superfamily enzyme